MKVYVDEHDKRWKKYKIDFAKIANTAVSGVYKESEVSIILVDDAEIHQINKQYRNVDKPTNVLSFELGDDVLLGDIYISLDTVQREAKQANISIEDHVAHLVVHGVLHLLGYDHITDDEAQVMEFKEINILKKMGIKNPYDDECKECKCPGDGFFAWLAKFKIKENGFWQYALYALFGGVAGFGFAPFYQWWWTLIGIAGAYWLTVRNKNMGGVWTTLLRVAPFGAMYAVTMFWWTLHSIYVVPELAQQFAIWTLPAVVGLMLAGIIIFSWPFVAVAKILKSAPARVFLFASVWMLVLWCREWMFTGFPWNPIANISLPWPVLANSMAVWGALGLTFLVVGGVACAVELVRDWRKKSLWTVAAIFVGLLFGGMCLGTLNMRYADNGAGETGVMLRLIQPGTSQVQKATHSREDAIKNAESNLRYLAQLAAVPGDVDIVVLPETTYPYYVMDDANVAFAKIIKRPLIMGALSVNKDGMFNSLVLVNEKGRVEQMYHKSHLVPFGEYKPLGILPAPTNLSAGHGAELMSIGNFVFAPAICYEVIFSDSLVVGTDAGKIDAIVNITNDNWFGNTPGTYQHLDMVRRYAIESGLPVVRANYSGISAFVAADGEVVSYLPIGEVGVLDGYVWGAHNTPYRMLGMNVWLIIFLCVGVFGVLLFDRKSE